MSEAYKSPCYCTNLRRSANAVSDYYDGALKPSGLTVAQYYLIVNLSRLGSANITRWAARVALERSTMVRNVKLLSQRGLIRLTEGRGKTFSLSEEGERALETAVPLWEAAQKRVEALLSPEDAAALYRISDKLQGLSEV